MTASLHANLSPSFNISAQSERVEIGSKIRGQQNWLSKKDPKDSQQRPKRWGLGAGHFLYLPIKCITLFQIHLQFEIYKLSKHSYIYIYIYLSLSLNLTWFNQ